MGDDLQIRVEKVELLSLGVIEAEEGPQLVLTCRPCPEHAPLAVNLGLDLGQAARLYRDINALAACHADLRRAIEQSADHRSSFERIWKDSADRTELSEDVSDVKTSD